MKIFDLNLTTKFLYQPGINTLHDFDNLFVVYLMVFPNEKMYCGYSSNLSIRWKSEHNYNGCPLVYKAINKYGWQNIKKYVIFSTSNQKQALDKEKEIIEKLNLLDPSYGYNLIPGGAETPHCIKLNLSEEQIKQKQEYMKNRWKDPEQAAFMKKRMKEEVHKSRMKKTPEERKRIWGKHNLGKIPPNAKTILQIDLNTGEVLNQYPSARQAAIKLNLNPSSCSNIQRTARGIGKSAYGYGWRWKE